MDSIGEMLRQARKKSGLTIDEVAARTRINHKFLEAIERGDRTEVPGGFFYKSFVRQYAAALDKEHSGLADDVERELVAEEGPVRPDAPVITIPSAKAEELDARPLGMYVLLLLMAIIGSTGLYLWWYRSQETVASAPPPAAQTAPPAHTSAAATAPPQPVPAPVETSAPAGTSADATAAGDQKITLDITAIEPTWFSVKSGGKTLFADTLEAGQSKRLMAEETATMRVGNAAGIQVMLNGKPIGPIGPPAQVRNVTFTPNGFEITAPKPKPPAEEEPQPQ